MPIASDFSIDTSKNIRYIGAVHGASGAGYYTVLQLHRWLQDLADDASSATDDFVDITALTPSDKQFDTIITLSNGYNIDDTASQYLFGGSIIQTNGDVIYDGIQVLATAGTHIEIIQNGAKIATAFWNNVPFGTGLKGLNPDSTNGIAARFLIKTRTAAADIDGRRLILQTREFGFSYSEFRVNGTSRGINVVPLTYATDLNNQTASGTVATWTTITNLNQGYNGIDVNNDAANEFYYSKWDRSTFTINQLYERLKYLTRRGTSDTLYGLNGELFRGITHEVALTTPRTGTFAAFEAVSWSGGTGQMLAIDSTTAGTKMWIQLLTGVAPTNTQTITGASTATAVASGTATERTLSFPFVGASTGTAIIGAYGFGVEATDLSANDKLFDLTNTQRVPPNYVTFTVSNLTTSDYLLVAPSSGGVIQTNQFTLNGALTGAAVTSVVVNEAIPADTPASGTLRILRVNGAYTRHPYSAYNSGTKTFTITSHNFSTNNAANAANTYVSYIDKTPASTSESFTTVYSADRTLFVRARNGAGTPIKTFESTATLASAGGSSTVVRTSDA